jgi:hypothetical protein
MSDGRVAATGNRPPNNSMQRTALRAAAKKTLVIWLSGDSHRLFLTDRAG